MSAIYRGMPEQGIEVTFEQIYSEPSEDATMAPVLSGVCEAVTVLPAGVEMVHVNRVICEDKGRYRVFFDTDVCCILYAKELRRYGIEEDCDIPAQRYQQLFSECLFKRARKRAMYLLERMDRTEHQLREKLRDNSYPQICIDDAVSYVKRFHYLDDDRYAERYVQIAQGRQSRRNVKRKLMQKGIAGNVADHAIEQEYVTDELQQIRTWIDKKRSVYDLSECRDVQKLYQFLLRRGFSGCDIRKVLNCEKCTIDNAFDGY